MFEQVIAPPSRLVTCDAGSDRLDSVVSVLLLVAVTLAAVPVVF
jgi:hypothetical protein